MSGEVSRRELFANLFTRVEKIARGQHDSGSGPSRAPAARAGAATGIQMMAVIQGRFCLAYHTLCSACSERCPVPEAIVVENGIPRVNWHACTGCGICHDVCPAPRNAVLLLPKRR